MTCSGLITFTFTRYFRFAFCKTEIVCLLCGNELISKSNLRLNSLTNKIQIDATYYFIVLLLSSTCFGHYYAHHQELATIMLITTFVVSFCKDGGGRVNVKLWFLVVCVLCEVVCRLI